MTGTNHGSNGASGGARKPDASMRDWVMILSPLGYVVGRLSGITEELLRYSPSREEVFALQPAYVVDARVHLFPGQDQLGRQAFHTHPNVQVSAAEWIFGRDARSVPWRGFSGPYAFLSEFPEAARKKLLEWVEQIERAQRAAESGIVLQG